MDDRCKYSQVWDRRTSNKPFASPITNHQQFSFYILKKYNVLLKFLDLQQFWKSIMKFPTLFPEK